VGPGSLRRLETKKKEGLLFLGNAPEDSRPSKIASPRCVTPIDVPVNIQALWLFLLRRAGTTSRLPESDCDKRLRVMDVATVYRHPPSSTPVTLRPFLSLRNAPRLPDTDPFYGIVPDETSETPQRLSHDQAFLPDLITSGFL
jgi:hypothetical protein